MTVILVTRVQKFMQLFDEKTQLWFDGYKAPGLEGRPICIEVPREERTPAKLTQRLLRAGASPTRLRQRPAELADAICSEAPIFRRSARTGWRSSGLFVAHLSVEGASYSETVLSPASRFTGSDGCLQCLGSLAEWKQRVKVAEHSTGMMFALCGPFAAPLLRLVGRQSVAFVLYGRSRGGKSSAQLLAASALGFGCEEDLPGLNASAAALLELPQLFNDHMLPINEIATAPGSKSDIGRMLRDVVYALTSGQDKLRHSSWAGAAAANSTSRTIALLSSEISPDAWADRGAERRDEGETARMIGVPVIAPGRRTVFDLPPNGLDGEELAEWEAEQYRQLRRELPKQRGVAFRDYLIELTGNREWAANRTLQIISDFEKAVIRPDMTLVKRDIVAKFGILLAGGIIAIEFGILPFNRQSLEQAVERACLAALGDLPDPQANLREDIKALSELLAGSSILNISNGGERHRQLIGQADGFWRRDGEGFEFVVRSQVFESRFRETDRRVALLIWLDDEGYLRHTKSRRGGRSCEWAQTQAIWLDGTRPRAYCIFLPHGVVDLEHAA